MKTTMGSIKIKLFPEHAPKTVENFLGHAKTGYYDGIIFHRVIADFMIQGGDPTGTGMGGESIWGGSFEDEFTHELFNLRGALINGECWSKHKRFTILYRTDAKNCQMTCYVKWKMRASQQKLSKNMQKLVVHHG